MTLLMALWPMSCMTITTKSVQKATNTFVVQLLIREEYNLKMQLSDEGETRVTHRDEVRQACKPAETQGFDFSGGSLHPQPVGNTLHEQTNSGRVVEHSPNDLPDGISNPSRPPPAGRLIS